MNSLRNQVTIVGDFGKNPQITTFASGAIVARFSLETESARKKSSKYRMFAWGNAALFVNQHCDPGKRVAVTGRLVNRTYLNRVGTVRRVTEVEVRQVVILR
jgi:single-strand DNA-binding protein